MMRKEAMRTAVSNFLAIHLSCSSWCLVLAVHPQGEGACSSAVSKAAIQEVEALFRKSIEHRTPQDIASQHAVILAPTDPLRVADGFAAESYLSLPRAFVNGNYTTVFTKFVVVGHSRKQGPKAVSLGEDVCGGGLTDLIALRFLRTKVFSRLAGFAPKVALCNDVDPCGERVAPGLAQQLPFLAALLGGSRSLQGALLPVMLQGQDVTMAVQLGDALSYLVQPGGIWQAERVLFVFAGDLSEGLPAAQKGICDQRMADNLVKRGVSQVAEYLHELLVGGVRGGCQGPAAAPKGYGPILAALRVAANARLMQRRAIVMHTGLPSDSVPIGRIAQPVRGYISALFWRETRPHQALLSNGMAMEQGPANSAYKSALGRHLQRFLRSQP